MGATVEGAFSIGFAVAAGLASGFLTWFAMSRAIAALVFNPRFAAHGRLIEAIACLLLFLFSLGVAISVAWLLWP